MHVHCLFVMYFCNFTESIQYETHVSNNSNFKAATCRDAVFHITPTPTVCYSVPSIVEVSGGCQLVNIMSAPTRDCYSELISILRKIHRLRNDRLRKHPWISAQTMDPQIAQADPWIAQIHRLRPTIIRRYDGVPLKNDQNPQTNCKPPPEFGIIGIHVLVKSKYLLKVKDRVAYFFRYIR